MNGARPPVLAMIVFIDDHRDAYGVKLIDRVDWKLQIAVHTHRYPLEVVSER